MATAVNAMRFAVLCGIWIAPFLATALLNDDTGFYNNFSIYLQYQLFAGLAAVIGWWAARAPYSLPRRTIGGFAVVCVMLLGSGAGWHLVISPSRFLLPLIVASQGVWFGLHLFIALIVAVLVPQLHGEGRLKRPAANIWQFGILDLICLSAVIAFVLAAGLNVLRAWATARSNPFDFAPSETEAITWLTLSDFAGYALSMTLTTILFLGPSSAILNLAALVAPRDADQWLRTLAVHVLAVTVAVTGSIWIDSALGSSLHLPWFYHLAAALLQMGFVVIGCHAVSAMLGELEENQVD
jgi:hypothetical protein